MIGYLHVVLFQVQLAWTAPQVVSPQEVLSLMARIPAVEVTRLGQEARPGQWEKRRDAKAIAEVISRVASSRKEAGRLALFAAFESGNDIHAVGDGGEAHGAWQLHGWCGLEALETQAKCWIRLEEKSEALCKEAGLPEAEQLAALVSGNCGHGRALAKRRNAMVDRILSEVFPEGEREEAVARE